MLPEIDAKRKTLLKWSAAALEAVDAERCTVAALESAVVEEVAVLAMGKASAGMARAAQRVMGRAVNSGLVIAPAPVPPPGERWRSRTGGHPLPDESSVSAGQALDRWLQAVPSHLPLLVLLSGGSSALVELPVDGVDLVSLQQLNRWLLGSGLDIRTMNAIRSRFSRLKRGGLLRLAGERVVVGLVMSDVPGDEFVDIGSGPLSPAPVAWPVHGVLPNWLNSLHDRLPLPLTATPARAATLQLIATNADALNAAATAAASCGERIVQRLALRGDAAEAGRLLARNLLQGPRGVYLAGGETTVTLPAGAGRGGRNQHLALAAACELAGRDDVALMSLATDGVDGNSTDAGALVDGGSIDRIRDAGLKPLQCLEMADSNKALAAAGDIIHTGPTGTNVMDIVIGWKF